VIGFWRSKEAPLKLLFFPGFGDTPISWVSVFERIRLSFNIEVILFDYPGFPGFLRHQDSLSDFKQLKEFAKDLIQEHKPDIISGHSLGAWLGLKALRELTFKPKAYLSLCSGGIFNSEDDAEQIREFFRQNNRGEENPLREKVFANPGNRLGFLLDETHAIMNRSGAIDLLDSLVAEDLLEHDLEFFDFPIHFLAGEKDGLYPPELFKKKWLPKVKQSTLEVLPDVAHCMQLEKPFKVADYFLRRLKNL
jgi:pimeloyl-ACP methyl ester carboxylesterase